jgi:hypothetical protein
MASFGRIWISRASEGVGVKSHLGKNQCVDHARLSARRAVVLLEREIDLDGSHFVNNFSCCGMLLDGF